jgi:diguanylate cyclase (GGDEF)-like protein
MQWADRRSTPRAVFSSHDSPHPGIIDLHSAEIIRTRRTLTYVANLNRPYSFYVGTPILIHDQVYGTIGFFDQTSPASPVHPQVREIIELMAKSIAIAIHQRNLTDQLAYQAQHDALTGLPNRLLLKDRLDNALDRARRNQGMVAVVFLDLDRFKQINDTLGHSIGDMLLQHVARRLRRCVGENDCLARMGGDEFTAILTGCQTQEQAAEIVRSLLTAIRKPSFVEGYELFVTASIGISFYPKDGRDAATLLRNADSAMYYTKNSGKDDFHFFSSENSETAREHLELENYLRRALANNELTIYYQPQVGINGILASFEVLLVWDHPKLGRISPTVFIPIAEESGMILQIGAWVLGEACRKVASWIESGISPVPVAVNVSALQFAQADFVSTVERVLLETSIDASLLELELTESLLMKDVEQSARRMAEIRALGVKISIDDFGTGYSSLSYLRRLPADSLKIDRSFLQDADRGHGRLSLIQTIVLLAHNMGLSVTAEGVEDSEQFELVRLAGCDKVQGHYFGAPLHSDTAEMLLKNQPDLTDSLPS